MKDSVVGTTNGSIRRKRGRPEVPNNEAARVAAQVEVAKVATAAVSSGAQPWKVLPQQQPTALQELLNSREKRRLKRAWVMLAAVRIQMDQGVFAAERGGGPQSVSGTGEKQGEVAAGAAAEETQAEKGTSESVVLLISDTEAEAEGASETGAEEPGAPVENKDTHPKSGEMTAEEMDSGGGGSSSDSNSSSIGAVSKDTPPPRSQWPQHPKEEPLLFPPPAPEPLLHAQHYPEEPPNQPPTPARGLGKRSSCTPYTREHAGC